MLRRSAGLVTVPLLLLLLAASPAAPVSADLADDLASFVGLYEHIGGERDRRALDAAIERVVGRMSYFVQGLARGQIRQNVRPEARVVVDVSDSERVRLTLGEWSSPMLAADGRPQTVRGPDGSATRFSVRHHAGRLYTRAETDRGTRESWLTLTRDGSRLRLQVRISSGRLPEAIDYELAFRRAS